MASNVLIPVTNDGDTLVVGKLLGATAVGFYNVAWQLANLVGRNITAVVSSVTMPALALLRDDEDRLRAAYLRMVRFLALVCFPLLVGMAVVAGDLIRTLYGERWEPAVGLLRIFVAFTLVRSVTSPSSMVYNVTGRPDLGFKTVLWFVPVYLLAIAVGSRWDATGIATGVMVARIGCALVDTRVAAGQIGLRMRAVFAAAGGPAALAAVMGVVVWVARQGMAGAGLGPIPRLVAATVLGAAVYAGGLAVVRPQGTGDLTRAFRSVRAGRRGRANAAEPVAVS
jgi:lipopolysaccharide exporter